MSWINKCGVREEQRNSPPSLFDPYPHAESGGGYRNWGDWKSRASDRPLPRNHGRKRDVAWKREE